MVRELTDICGNPLQEGFYTYNPDKFLSPTQDNVVFLKFNDKNQITREHIGGYEVILEEQPGYTLNLPKRFLGSYKPIKIDHPFIKSNINDLTKKLDWFQSKLKELKQKA